ncbi:MAG TPA: CaiB/BaiF CoA-transferase family protein [Steroidobacter sp.]|uniref:CaiB/BaiF CoA transferase family protein n=1 Tax=Steroidobacter sp. TaxID=1978227 RepID=UPI002ED81E94
MGPLEGVRVLEIGGVGPTPFCGMMLADLGAEVVRFERAGAGVLETSPKDPLLRGRRSISLNLKQPRAIEVALRLVESADVLIEGFRPGVAERLGLGPQVCLARNSRLIYGRMTGWGQEGPLAQAAGHDINYIALSGALHLIGTPGGKPVPPLNLVADFGGGGMLLALGVLAALHEVRRSGQGQVVDATMLDGVAAMMAMYFGFRAQGQFRDRTGENFLAGAAPYYDVYETKDGAYVAIGSLEPQFYAELLERLGLDRERYAASGMPALDEATRRERWPELREAIASAFRSRTRAEWCERLEGTDVCFAPVLSLEEAPCHPHNLARGTFMEVDGLLQNAPAPRFSRSTLDAPRPPRKPGEDSDALLCEAGYSEAEIEILRREGALS